MSKNLCPGNLFPVIGSSEYRTTGRHFRKTIGLSKIGLWPPNIAEIKERAEGLLLLQAVRGETEQRAGEAVQKASEAGPPAVDAYGIRKRQGSKQERLSRKQVRLDRQQ